jgi:hypothetical protein
MDVAEVLARPISRELLESSIPARFAYVGIDGDPRVVPIAFLHRDGEIVMFTLPGTAKVPALRRNPRVSLTIDTESFPPRALLIRGTARVDVVDGMPDDFVTASAKLVPAERFDEWERGVRALYERMAVITVRPDWAKLLDFETTLPKAVEDLVRPVS